MTKGSEVHDELSRHVRACKVCSSLSKGDDARKSITVNPPVVGLCRTGQAIYERWRAWCLSDD